MDHLKPEPKPYKGDQHVWKAVIQDMQKRDHDGTLKYNRPLMTFDGRKSLVDAYQEALDLVVYLKKYLMEHE